MVDAHTIELGRAMLYGIHRKATQKQPVIRGELPESVDEAIEVPLPLAEPGGDDCTRILHVDDNPDIGELTKVYLEEECETFSVTTTTNAVEAIETLQDGEFDCVVSDYDMPNTNGIELLELVRETHPDLPFILFTAEGDEQIASEAFAAGATDYMQKAVGSDQYRILADRVRNAVEGYRTRQYFWNALSWYQTLVEHSVAGVFVVQDGEFFFVNQRLADLLGYYQSDLIGRPPTELASTAEDESRLEELERCERTPEKTFDAEVSVSTRDGDELPVKIQGGTVQHDGELGCLGLLWRQSTPSGD